MGIQSKHIILGICGGISAYKSVELLRLLKKGGASVRVVMTQNAQWFVGPLSFRALSGLPVCTDLFGSSEDASIRHIHWAETADAVVVAPATANIIGKLANGIADDALSTFMLAVTCPRILCPSMNSHMYESKVVQRNLTTLKNDGYIVVEPESGALACGTVGPGRLPQPETILAKLLRCLSPQDLKGRHVLITAGPTIEPIDPVRFISNPSSGKMGYALAKAAVLRGAAVTLITGPTSLPDIKEVTLIRVRTAAEMARCVFDHMDGMDIVVKAAAVSDYRPVETFRHKIKKGPDEMVIYLEKTMDILRELGGRKKDRQILVGFAAETEALEKNAKRKLTEKNLDMMVGNLVGTDNSGFQANTNTVTLFYRDGTAESLPPMIKEDVAHLLFDRIIEKFLNCGDRPK
jgi:phosphopantothenoylcysteine decarboxylase/phosphopantothenate--cysteine ligase